MAPSTKQTNGLNIMYMSELKETTNTKTNKTYYFILICDVWQRVSKKDYQQRENDSYSQNCFLTKTKGHMVYNTKTVYMHK